MKKCKLCKTEKPLSEYAKQKLASDGLQNKCKACQKRYRENNKKKHESYIKKYRSENKEKIAITVKAYSEKNSDKIADYLKHYCYKNRDSILKKNIERKEDIAQVKRVYKKKKMREDPVYAMAHRLGVLMRNALKHNGYLKNMKTLEALGCTAAQFKDHLEKQFLKGMTWDNRALWQLDHITPISSAKTEQDVYTLSHMTNIRPMWAKENMAKSNNQTHLI